MQLISLVYATNFSFTHTLTVKQGLSLLLTIALLSVHVTDWMLVCQSLCLVSMIICLVAVVVASVGLRTSNFQAKYKLYWVGLVCFFSAGKFVFFPIKCGCLQWRAEMEPEREATPAALPPFL